MLTVTERSNSLPVSRKRRSRIRSSFSPSTDFTTRPSPHIRLLLLSTHDAVHAGNALRAKQVQNSFSYSLVSSPLVKPSEILEEEGARSSSSCTVKLKKTSEAASTYRLRAVPNEGLWKRGNGIEGEGYRRTGRALKS